MMPGAGDTDHVYPADDQPPDRDDERPQLRLTRQDVLPEQRGLFRGIAPGRPNAELLVLTAKEYHLATVDDLLAWEMDGGLVAGVCIACHTYFKPIPPDQGTRVYCELCGTHTVCKVQDVAIGDTPGPVKEVMR